MILTRYCLAFLFVVFAIIFGYIAKSILIIGIVVIYDLLNQKANAL